MWPATRSIEECTFSPPPHDFEYVESSCLIPSLESTYFEWEKNAYKVFEPVYYWMCESTYLAYIAVAAYAILIFLEKKFMENRKPFNWRKIMAGWNLFLSLYSGATMVRTGIPLMYLFATESVRTNLCRDVELYGRGSLGLWVFFFVWSKYFELFDTFFIIIHKKPLIFLHWYHHITVLVFTWDCYVRKAPAGLIYCAMNSAVHFIMYGYYFLMAIKVKPKWMNAMFITVAQITQMVIGIVVAVATLYFYLTDNDPQNPCYIKKSNVAVSSLIYGSYLFLFLQFFFQKYGGAKTKTKVKKQ